VRGFDLASDGNRLAAITSAENSKQVSATGPVRLVQADGDRAGILLVYPVSESPNGPGIVLVVLRMQTFVERLHAPLASAIKLKLSDATSHQPLFDNIDEQAVTPFYEASFEFGTRRYLLRTAPTRLYLASHFGWESWFILVAGMLCTGLLGALLLLATGYGQRADDLVEERTAELQTANRRLSTEISERERAEAALLQARRMEAIGQLTGGVAHDFNNLLTIIQGNLELLRKHIQTKRAADILTAADRGAQRGAQLVASLLAFARRQMLRPEIIDPNQLIREFSDLIQRAVGDAVELHLVLHPTAGFCCVDPAQFQAALLNLAVNARDAMLDGGSLTIECGSGASSAPAMAGAETAEDGGYVVIAVRDTGRGMTPEVMERAFEPFYTTKDVGVGSGLGLSQVYGFVQQSGGQVEIASAPSNGTIVTIYLPRHDQLPAADGDDKAAKARAPGGHEIVLVVEDDADVRQLAANILRELGYGVLTAADGIEAVSILRGNEPIDLLFSDIVMPKGLRGDKLASEAKALRPDLRILLTSGYTAEPAVGIASVVTVLRKPYRRDDLAHAIRAALDSEQHSTLSP
jgi:signal transduction histidine kinase/CheY-like chemotaxis protein